MELKELEKTVLATLTYYDLQDFPLTKIEVEKFCIPNNHFGLDNVDKNYRTTLNSLIEKGLIEQKRGFYMLKDRSDIYKERIKRKKISDDKWKKAIKIFKWFQGIPYIRAVYASGSLALENTDPLSDFDALIITKHGRIWTARLLLLLVISLFGVRRKRFDKIAPNKICLNHYITDKSLHIPFHSIYNAHTYAHLVSVWTADKEINKLFEVENGWILKYINNWNFSSKLSHRIVKNNFILKTWAKFLEFILNTKAGDLFENFARKIQYNRIISNPTNTLPGGRITVDDKQLEFHPMSPEKGVVDKFNKKIGEIINGVDYRETDSGLLK